VISDLEDEFTRLPAETDFGSCTTRVVFNIGERFLCDAKQGYFYTGGDPAQPVGKLMLICGPSIWLKLVT
jgi:hypothetical protein